MEHLLPLLSTLNLLDAANASDSRSEWSLDRIMLLNLKRTHIFPWVRCAIAAAVGVTPGGSLPPLLFQQETESIYDQIGSLLEGMPKNTWLRFEYAVLVKDGYSGGSRVASVVEDAQMFRTRAYMLQSLPQPMPLPHYRSNDGASHRAWTSFPANVVATLLRKSANRRIVNERGVVGVLRKFAATVNIVEFTADTPVKNQLEAMSSTTILVSTHTSGLANAMFLPPGAVVIELIQRNWVWANLDQVFRDHTRSLGDVHHFAWRATKKEHVRYIRPRDEERFGSDDWAGEKVQVQCSTVFSCCC